MISEKCDIKAEVVLRMKGYITISKSDTIARLTVYMLKKNPLKVIAVMNLQVYKNTRWFKYDQDYLCVNKSQFVPVIFEPPCMCNKASSGKCQSQPTYVI
jgi:hypothetical protein